MQRHAGKEILDPTELLGDVQKKAQDTIDNVVNAPTRISEKAEKLVENTVETFTKDDGRVLDENSASGAVGAIAVGTAVLPYIPVSLYSSWLVATTGSGIEAGPSGLFGAAEGFATLVVISVALWSLVSLITRARGLPAGPFGILGATQVLSWVAVLAFAGATALTGGSNLNPLSERPATQVKAKPEATKQLEKEIDTVMEAPTNFFTDIQKQLDAKVDGVKKQVDSQVSSVKEQADKKAAEVAEKATASVSKATTSLTEKASSTISEASKKASATISEKAKSLPKVELPDYKDLLGDDE